MRVTLMLCDYAVVAEGKLYISGGGWSVAGPAPGASAIALKLDVPWDRTNTPIKFRLRLLGADGEPVTQPGALGAVPVEFAGELEVGRPPGIKQGTPIDVPLALNIPALALPPGRRFSWELEIDGQTETDWHLAFSTRDVPAPPNSPTNIPPVA